jgi:hypothetical protein
VDVTVTEHNAAQKDSEENLKRVEVEIELEEVCLWQEEEMMMGLNNMKIRTCSTCLYEFAVYCCCVSHHLAST